MRTVLTVYLQLPAVLHARVRYLRVVGPAAHVLAGVAHGRHVVDDAQGHVAVGRGLQGGRAKHGNHYCVLGQFLVHAVNAQSQGGVVQRATVVGNTDWDLLI